MICIGSTVGIGFVLSSGEILAIAGPGGALIAYAVVGIAVTSVMEGICEMTSLWPISNAMTKFVRAFVDEDLALVVGLTYWYISPSYDHTTS
jgi:yeast amino acid transporter